MIAVLKFKRRGNGREGGRGKRGEDKRSVWRKTRKWITCVFLKVNETMAKRATKEDEKTEVCVLVGLLMSCVQLLWK